MASNPAINTSSTPSQTDEAQDEPTTSTSLGYSTSLSAPVASSTTSSSSSSPSSQSILTMTLQPTIITTMPPSGVSTASGSSSPTASPVFSIRVAHSTAFIAGVTTGSVIFAAAVVVSILFCLFLRKRRRQARRGDFIHHNVLNPASADQRDPVVTENTAQDIDYRTRWPLQRSLPESLANRSGLHPLVPDHDQDRLVQPNLYGPPASDPYAVPPVDPDVRREASRLQCGPGPASPSNYRPTMRGSNRPRGNAYRNCLERLKPRGLRSLRSPKIGPQVIKGNVDRYERCECILGLGYEWKVVKSSVYGNLLPLRKLRWSDKSPDGVLAGYHTVPVVFSFPSC